MNRQIQIDDSTLDYIVNTQLVDDIAFQYAVRDNDADTMMQVLRAYGYGNDSLIYLMDMADAVLAYAHSLDSE